MVRKDKPLGVDINLVILSTSVINLSACVIAPPLIKPSVKLSIWIWASGLLERISIVGFVTNGSWLKPWFGLSNALSWPNLKLFCLNCPSNIGV